MEKNGEKRKLSNVEPEKNPLAKKVKLSKKARWKNKMRRTQRINNLIDLLTYYNDETDKSIRAKITFQICDPWNRKREIYMERLLRRYQRYFPIAARYSSDDFPEELLRESHANFLLLDLVRNVFILSETQIEQMPMNVVEDLILRVTQTKQLFFNQYIVLKEYFKFYISQKCFTIAKYFLIMLKYIFVEYERDLRGAFEDVPTMARYDNHMLKLLFYDYHENLCFYMIQMLMHNEYEYTNQYIHPNIHYDLDRGNWLLSTLSDYKLNGDWLPSRILQFSDVITCSTIMETVSKAYLQFILNLYPKFSLYRKAATRMPEINKDKTVFLYHPVDVANKRKYMKCVAKYIRAVYQIDLYSKYTDLAEVIKEMEPFKKLDHNREHKWEIYKLIDNSYAHLWKLELIYFASANVDIPTKTRALMEITDKRLESGKYLMSCNGGFQADFDVLYDFVCFFILVRKDLQSAHDYAQEMLDNFQRQIDFTTFVDIKRIIYINDMDEEEVIDSIIQSAYRRAPKVARQQAQAEDKAEDKAEAEGEAEDEVQAEDKAEEAEVQAEGKAEEAEVQAEDKAEEAEVQAEDKAEEAEVQAEDKAEEAEVQVVAEDQANAQAQVE